MARVFKKDANGDYSCPPPEGGVGTVLVLLGWNVIARLDEVVTDEYVKEVQTAALNSGGDPLPGTTPTSSGSRCS